MSRPQKPSYAAAGVDIDAAEALVTRFADLAKSARRPEVLADIGPFAGLFKLGSYREPVLVASTDSVGTKVKLAVVAGRYDTVGHDLVNHCVNDILCTGAHPLFFLDYIGTSQLSDETKLAVIDGMARACEAHGCALIGGETADMPDVYAAGDFDLVGFIVGVVEREHVIEPSRVREGDVLLALPSTGLHTNGYTLVRKIFGIGMGGEWGVGASLAMEKAPARRRGLLSGFLQEGYACGYLLAAIVYFLVFPKWGWRPLFFIGGLPALLAIYVRSQVTESEVWLKTRHSDWSSLGRSIVSHWRLFLYLVLLMTMMNFVSHGTQDMYPTFLQRDWNFTPGMRAALTAFSMVGAIIGGLITGHLSDRFGRRRAMIAALLGAILVIPAWAFAPSIGVLVAGAFLMQFMVQGAWGVIPAHITELAPDSVRGFLPGFAYQCGVALAGSVAVIEAVFARNSSYAVAMALTAVTVFSLAALVTWAGKEKPGIVFGEGTPGKSEGTSVAF